MKVTVAISSRDFWGYRDYHAIFRGVVTPSNTNFIILFVTKNKQFSSIQYNDYIDGSFLFWEGEFRHGSDQRIVGAADQGDEIHLFYREIHHTPFVYFGTISLLTYELRSEQPSKFAFRIDLLPSEPDALMEIREHASEYNALTETEREQIVQSRLGQGRFRRDVVGLWGSCSLTGVENVGLLRASHIKPWKDSDNQERLSPFNGLLLIPNYDLLLDQGFIGFRDDGEILISSRLDFSARGVFAVHDGLRLRQVFSENQAFLEYHRDTVFV